MKVKQAVATRDYLRPLFHLIWIIFIKSSIQETILWMQLMNLIIQKESLIMCKLIGLNQLTRLHKEFGNFNKIVSWRVNAF